MLLVTTTVTDACSDYSWKIPKLGIRTPESAYSKGGGFKTSVLLFSIHGSSFDYFIPVLSLGQDLFCGTRGSGLKDGHCGQGDSEYGYCMQFHGAWWHVPIRDATRSLSLH